MQDGLAIGDGGEEVGGKGNPGDDDDAGPGVAVIRGQPIMFHGKWVR